MLFACWSVKGGSGTTVVATALALVLAESSPEGVLLVDCAGDVPAALGLPEPDGPGLADWLAAPEASPDALARLAVEASASVRLVPWQGGLNRPEGDSARLLDALGAAPGPVVVDVGAIASKFALGVAASASVSLLVMRPCYMSVRRATAAPIRPSGVILVHEPGRVLKREDVEAGLGVPVRAELVWSEGVARLVDVDGLLGRVPRSLAKPLREAA
jgi:MinD-like ATPase involved in chromosome partitioning or flagellar assembly